MKAFFILLLSFSLALNSFGQSDSGFTNKKEAYNQLIQGIKEGKWIEYSTESDAWQSGVKKKHWRFYRLVVYRVGIPSGLVREYYRSGKPEGAIFYIDGKRSGLAKEYYESGKLWKETTFGNDGITRKIYDENGCLELTDTINGDIDKGILDIYYPTGKLLYACIFTTTDSNKETTIEMAKIQTTLNNVKAISQKEYFEDGKLESESYGDGRKSGITKEYYESGKLKSETTYTGGVSSVKTFDENGHPLN